MYLCVIQRWQDLNVVSSLLKSFFRKLPEPLFTDGKTCCEPQCLISHRSAMTVHICVFSLMVIYFHFLW